MEPIFQTIGTLFDWGVCFISGTGSLMTEFNSFPKTSPMLRQQKLQTSSYLLEKNCWFTQHGKACQSLLVFIWFQLWGQLVLAGGSEPDHLKPTWPAKKVAKTPPKLACFIIHIFKFRLYFVPYFGIVPFPINLSVISVPSFNFSFSSILLFSSPLPMTGFHGNATDGSYSCFLMLPWQVWFHSLLRPTSRKCSRLSSTWREAHISLITESPAEQIPIKWAIQMLR